MKEILNNFWLLRNLENLQEEIYKINNPEDFIDKAEEFKSIYEPLKNIDFFQKKFWNFYNQLIKKLEELQKNILKITQEKERIKYEIQKTFKKWPANNVNYNPQTKEEN